MAISALINGITGQEGSYSAELLLVKGYKVYDLTAQSFVGTSWNQNILTSDVTTLGAVRLEAMRHFCKDARPVFGWKAMITFRELVKNDCKG